MKVKFTKMSGAGNDFVFLGPEYAEIVPRLAEVARTLCRRRLSVGADGLILVERGPAREVFTHRLHPYSQVLFSAALPFHPDTPHEDVNLQGEVPSPLNPPSGCRFHTRCPQVMKICSKVEPPLEEAYPGHLVACHLLKNP